MATWKAAIRTGTELVFSAWESSTNIANNTSVVSWEISINCFNGYSLYGAADYYVNINGSRRVTREMHSFNIGANGSFKFASGTHSVTHDPDGKKSINVNAWIDSGSGAASISKTLTLTSFDRYLAFTTVSIDNITANSVRVRNVTDANWNSLQYSTNGGSSWVTASSSVDRDHTYTISGLAPYTTYQLRFRARKSDSNQWTTTGNYARTTLGYAAITNLAATKVTDSWIAVNVATDVAVNSIEYGIDGGGLTGEWQVVTLDSSTVTNQNFTIRKLKPNTEYNIQVRVTRADSGLMTTSDSVFLAKTLAGAKFFDIGDY